MDKNNSFIAAAGPARAWLSPHRSSAPAWRTSLGSFASLLPIFKLTGKPCPLRETYVRLKPKPSHPPQRRGISSRPSRQFSGLCGSGFTLIEILIALSILAIVVISSYTVLRGIADSWLKGEARTERYKNVRVMLEIMGREISQAIVSVQPVYCLGQGDRVFFVYPVGRSEDESDLVEVGYWLRLTDNALVRHYQRDPDYNFQTADSVDEIGENVREVEFRYYDGSIWRENWDSRLEGAESNQLPKAIKVRLTLTDEKVIQSETFETIIHLATSGK